MSTDVITIEQILSLHPEKKQKYHPENNPKKQGTKKYEKATNQNEVERVIPCLMLSWKLLSDII